MTAEPPFKADPDAPPTPVTFADIESAARTIEGVANRTPVVTSRTLNERLGVEAAFIKCENVQRTGAFKFRGAYNALSNLSDDEKKRGILTYSSGNHAQAIALAGRLLRVPTTIVMPSDAPALKLSATRGYLGEGSEVIEYDRATTSRETLGAELAEQRGLTIVPPYDHPHVIAGQGTSANELFEEAGELDALFVCCGGGGLLSGSAISARRLSPRCTVIGVEPELADDATRSFESRTLCAVENPPTIADGARTPYLGRWTFPLVLANVDRMLTVPDAALIDAMRFCFERLKIVIEPTGGLGLAGAVQIAEELRGKRIGIIVSGGNVDLARFSELTST
ncbi:MAG: threo-3-hydroxy-L-aspartate ammonia-lyase [Phycisphaerales bacterium]